MEKNLIKITYIGYNLKRVIMCVLILFSMMLTVNYFKKDNYREDIIEDVQTFIKSFTISFVILLVILIVMISGIKHKFGMLVNSLYILFPLLCVYIFINIETKYYSDFEYINSSINKNPIKYLSQWVPFVSVLTITLYIYLFQSKIALFQSNIADIIKVGFEDPEGLKKQLNMAVRSAAINR